MAEAGGAPGPHADVMLVAEALDEPIPKGYIYSTMAFSLFVEMLNLRAHRDKDRRPVRVHDTSPADAAEASS